MGTYAKRLRAMQKNFQAAQEDYKAGFGSDNVPASVYSFKVSKFELGESSNDNLLAFRELTVTEGEFKGQTVNPNFAIETDFGLKQCLAFFEQVGYEVEGLQSEDVETIIGQIAESEVEFKGKLTYSKKSGFPNVTLLEVYGTEESEGESEESADESVEEDSVEEDSVEEDSVEEDSVEEDSVDDSVLDGLKEFCNIRGLEVNEDDSLDQVVEVLKEYEFKRSEMTDDDIQLFEDAGLEELFEEEEEKPAPKKPATKKAATKKAASRIRKKK